MRHNAIHRLGDGIPTLAEHLHTAGYATAAVVGSLVLDSRFGLTRGFDVYDDVMAGRVSAKVDFASAFASHPYAGEIASTTHNSVAWSPSSGSVGPRRARCWS